MKTYWITYQTKWFNENDTNWATMPHRVIVAPLRDETPEQCFGRIFKEVFGDTLQFRILKVEDK